MYLPKPNDTNFEPPPAGTHLAVCYRVIDLGTQDVEWQGQAKKQRKIMLSWELPDEHMADGQPFSVHQRYTLSSSERSKLRQDLEAWRGTPFSEADYGTFRIEKVIGIGCLLGIVHAQKNGNTYANISALMKLPKGQKAPDLLNPPCYFSLDPAEFNQATFDALSNGLRAVIEKSPEYQEIMHRQRVPDANGFDDRNPPPIDNDGDPIPF